MDYADALALPYIAYDVLRHITKLYYLSLISPPPNNMAQQKVRERASDAMQLEQLSELEFRSGSLWVPYGHRSAYGGQLMAQAICSASKCVDSRFNLHVRFLSVFFLPTGCSPRNTPLVGYSLRPIM